MAELVLATLMRVWTALEPLRLPMAVVGGIALSVWKIPRATRDVDLLMTVPVGEAPRLINHLSRFGIVPRRRPHSVTVADMEVLQLLCPVPDTFVQVQVQVDLLLGNSTYQHQAIARAVELQLPDSSAPVRVLACEDLILHKLIAGRLIDLADVEALLTANRSTLDDEYLRRWATQLGVASALDERWRAAERGQ